MIRTKIKHGGEVIMEYEMRMVDGEWKYRVYDKGDWGEWTAEHPYPSTPRDWSKETGSAPTVIAIGDRVKIQGAMTDTLSRIAENHPTSPLADRFLRRSNKQVKEINVLKKHGIIE